MAKEWLFFRGTFSVLLALFSATGVRQQRNTNHFCVSMATMLREFPTILRYTHNFYFVLGYRSQRLLRAIYVNV
jgi:hypothetical protein